MKKFKLLVIGYGRHGKDTVCEILKKHYAYTFESSSLFCAKLFIFDELKNKYNYSSVDECFNDRHNHRSEWFQAISNYNHEDPARLGKEIFAEHDIYCGLRNKREFFAMKNLGVFDYCFWVDRSNHLPPESESSMNLTASEADFVIDNNENIDDLEQNTTRLMNYLISKNQESNRLVSTHNLAFEVSFDNLHKQF